ncbi:MAG: hypothetical protein QMB08_04230 [Acidimicrobiales bacterium]
MTHPSPLVHDTATALRLAFGPGYGFGGPSDRQLEVILRNTSVANGGKPRR